MLTWRAEERAVFWNPTWPRGWTGKPGNPEKIRFEFFTKTQYLKTRKNPQKPNRTQNPIPVEPLVEQINNFYFIFNF